MKSNRIHPDSSPSHDTGAPLEGLVQFSAALSSAVDDAAKRELALNDLTLTDYRILMVLMTDEDWSVTDLSRALLYGLPAISRRVGQLVEKGLISRRRPREDRRIVLLKLTEAGWELALRLRQRMQDCEDRLCDGISGEEMDSYRLVVRQILSNCRR